MGTYIIRRLLQALVVLLLVTALVFLTVRLLPGNPILLYLTNQEFESITPEQIEVLEKQYGLDRPMFMQYFDWLGDILRGDLGVSIYSEAPVTGDLKAKLPVSLYLGSIAFIFSTIIGVTLGTIAAVRRGGWLDNFITGFGNLGIAVPAFWLAVLLIYLFSLKLQILPIYGYTSPFTDFWLSTKQIILPVFCLIVPTVAGDVRLVRSSMLEVMRQDYIRTAWSKGLRERFVIFKHALKNGLAPVITLKGMGIAAIFGGQVFVEQIFNIPGMGRLSVNSLFNQDYAVIQGLMLVIASVMLLANLLVDLSYSWLDPRVRYG
jgi:peptide/nickel transport system permease protein